MKLFVRAVECGGPAAHDVEVVERKGLGHPDTICDALAEHLSVRLCRAYLARFGAVQHHNVDKILLSAGSSRADFGGGEVTQPIEIYVGGRAVDGDGISVHDITIDACVEWLRANLPALDVERHVKIFPRVRPGSRDLTSLFDSAGVVRANDSSVGVGFAPFTELERVVLAVEAALNDPATKRAHPAIGSDVKVLGTRLGTKIELTIGCAFVAGHVRDINDYVDKMNAARGIALNAARRETSLDVDAVINAADDINRGVVFLTVTGTSAEAGDDGEVGRGNRASGLITPYRSMSMEAAAGKNPVSHVGKLYQVAAGRIASAVSRDVAGAGAASCVLTSRIGHAVNEPALVDVRVSGEVVAARVDEVVRRELARLDEVRDEIVAGRVALF